MLRMTFALAKLRGSVDGCSGSKFVGQDLGLSDPDRSDVSRLAPDALCTSIVLALVVPNHIGWPFNRKTSFPETQGIFLI